MQDSILSCIGYEPSNLTGDADVPVVGTATEVVQERAIMRGELTAQCGKYK